MFARQMNKNDLLTINDVVTPGKVDFSLRCGESSCVPRPDQPYNKINLADPSGQRASQRQEQSLIREHAQYGDIARVDEVDEYSRSSAKMKAFIRKLGTDPATAGVQFFLKLDDDNVCDVARIACGETQSLG